jgi:hypothetical protein
MNDQEMSDQTGLNPAHLLNDSDEKAVTNWTATLS